jgi:hypothetical protein
MISVWDMLHGLMLPSGNDAAVALAEHFGSILLEEAELERPLEEEKKAASQTDVAASSNPQANSQPKPRRNIFISRNT